MPPNRKTKQTVVAPQSSTATTMNVATPGTELVFDISKILPKKINFEPSTMDDKQKKEYIEAIGTNSAYNSCILEINRHMSPDGPFRQPISIFTGLAHSSAPDCVEKLEPGTLTIDQWQGMFDYYGLVPRKKPDSPSHLEQEYIGYWKMFAGILDVKFGPDSDDEEYQDPEYDGDLADLADLDKEDQEYDEEHGEE
ncbi:hypothetical protein Dda_6961 [Drechslerella dactyloides]|uniref:Uncharacterized protein n=1 Tax=Drechslerella dactyloides TaxID=74499 RepID=A0AAD6IU27_DREDA|nr:hypothetical protein Dda_6961 [Drechslerella dactyloides]